MDYPLIWSWLLHVKLFFKKAAPVSRRRLGNNRSMSGIHYRSGSELGVFVDRMKKAFGANGRFMAGAFG